MERNILLKIEYDGGAYCGWQIQPNVPTVQGEIEKALRRTTGYEIHINGTSRTDAGVHALGQQASFKTECAIPIERIAFAVNNALPKDIRITGAKEMDHDFHARFSAVGKRYIYKMKEHVGAFEARYYYEIPEELDLVKMQQAAAQIKGKHDFKCFQAAGSDIKETTVRTIFDIEVKRTEPAGFEVIVSGDGFLYNMVRIITGTLVDVGRGRISADKIRKVIESRDRAEAGHTAPPQGLYLAEVFY